MCEKKVRKNEIFDKMQHVTKKVLDIINIVIMNQEDLYAEYTELSKINERKETEKGKPIENWGRKAEDLR